MENVRLTELPDPRIEPTVTVERTADVLGVSRGSAYDAVRRGELPSLRLGHRILVPTAALLRLLGVESERATSRPDKSVPSSERRRTANVQ